MEYAFGDFTLDLARGELRCGARPVALEPRAFALLAHMLEHQGRLVEKDELIASVWGGRIVSDAAISTAIKAVRRALGDDGSAPVWLKTVRGRGFRFDGAVERRDKAEEGREERSGGKALAPNSPPTIVVLPFSHSPDNDERRWLIDAISDDVLTGLSLFRDLRVISRLTSFGLGNLSSTALSQALAELGADYMVEGSLRKQGAVFRLSVALSDAKSGQQVWGGRWDLSREALQDLFPVDP